MPINPAGARVASGGIAPRLKDVARTSTCLESEREANRWFVNVYRAHGSTPTCCRVRKLAALKPNRQVFSEYVTGASTKEKLSWAHLWTASSSNQARTAGMPR